MAEIEAGKANASRTQLNVKLEDDIVEKLKIQAAKERRPIQETLADMILSATGRGVAGRGQDRAIPMALLPLSEGKFGWEGTRTVLVGGAGGGKEPAFVAGGLGHYLAWAMDGGMAGSAGATGRVLVIETDRLNSSSAPYLPSTGHGSQEGDAAMSKPAVLLSAVEAEGNGWDVVRRHLMRDTDTGLYVLPSAYRFEATGPEAYSAVLDAVGEHFSLVIVDAASDIDGTPASVSSALWPRADAMVLAVGGDFIQVTRAVSFLSSRFRDIVKSGGTTLSQTTTLVAIMGGVEEGLPSDELHGVFDRYASSIADIPAPPCGSAYKSDGPRAALLGTSRMTKAAYRDLSARLLEALSDADDEAPSGTGSRILALDE